MKVPEEEGEGELAKINEFVEKKKLKVKMLQVHARGGGLQLRQGEVEGREQRRLADQEQGTAAEQGGVPWEVKEEELLQMNSLAVEGGLW